MKYRAVLAVLLAVSLFACASYDHLPDHVRVVEFIVPGCD
jgi:type IV pilus biogenesis protein CpaD/CtpE